eukprot:g19519.t1
MRTIHIEVLDKGRFNPQHTLGQAKPLLVKEAVDQSGTPIELFAPVAGLDEVGDESCGSVDMEFELLQPRMGLRPQCELCMLRIKIDKVYVPEEFPQPVALHARCSDSEKQTPFVSQMLGVGALDGRELGVQLIGLRDKKPVKVDVKESKDAKDAKPPIKRLGTLFPEEEEKQPVELCIEYVLHLLLKQEDLKTHTLELQLVDRKKQVFASKEVELKQLVDRKAFRRVWGSEKQCHDV